MQVIITLSYATARHSYRQLSVFPSVPLLRADIDIKLDLWQSVYSFWKCCKYWKSTGIWNPFWKYWKSPGV